MNSYTLFNTQIKSLKGRILKRTLERFLLYMLLFFCPLATITLITIRTGLLHGERNALFAMTLVISFLLALFLMVKRQGSLMDELIDMDNRLRLHSRLSTAYEYGKSRDNSPYGDLLIRDASHELQAVNPGEMFPRLLDRIHLLIPMFFISFIIALYWDYSPHPFKKEYIDDPVLQRISMQMKDFIEKESKTLKDKEIRHHEEVYRTLEDMVESLHRHGLNRNELLESVRMLTQRVQAERKSAVRRMRTTLNPGDINRTPVLKPLEDQSPDPDEVRKMGEYLKELFQGRMPASITDDISALEKNGRFLQFLNQIQDELQADNRMENSQLVRTEEMQVFQERTPMDMDKEESEASSKSAVAGDQGTGIMQGHSTLTGQERAATSGESGDSGEGKTNESADPRAGHDRASGTQNAAAEIKSPQIPAIRERGVSVNGERYSAQVRSLTAIGSPGMNEAEVIRAHEREIEEVLKKEDIPLNFRQYIKNYFLSIGIGRIYNANEYAD